jgi:pilus assembly protein Flp/PilA
MDKIIAAARAFIADENGVTAIEYGLIASLIGVAMVVAATALGGKVSDAFDYVKGLITVPAS